MAKPSLGNIKVGVRMRPLISREISDPTLYSVKWRCQENKVVRIDTDYCRDKKLVEFDHVFDKNSTNKEVFEQMLEPLVTQAVDGFNATILAYGQTSSGKTHTMMGTEEEKGIIPLCLDYIFKAIDKLPDGRMFLLGVNFLEVYNEKVQDLLSTDRSDLKVVEDKEFGPKVDCKTEMVNTADQMLELVKLGNQNKAVGETNMNDRSSRSHTIFRILIESQDKSNSDEASVSRCSQINLVDLAGSERASQTGATGQRYKEGCAINKSLLHLGNVVQKLSENKGDFIDYRTSKLTRILQASLSGNANIAMICNITPVNLEQTNSTLQFASRASTIKVSPHLNEIVDEATLIRRHTKKIKELEMELKDAVNLKERNQSLQKEMEKLKEMLVMSKLPHFEPIIDERERALRRQTWGGHLGRLPHRQQLLSKAKNMEHNVDFLLRSGSAEPDCSLNNSWDTSNLSTEELPSTMLSASDTSDRSSLPITPDKNRYFETGAETPPWKLRERILNLQKNVGTPPYLLKKKVSALEEIISQLSVKTTTSSTVLQERISVLGEKHTPVSQIKLQLQQIAIETPPAILRQELKNVKQHMENLEKEHSELREFTTIERQIMSNDQVTQQAAEIESLLHTVQDYKQECLEVKREKAQLICETQDLQELISELQNSNKTLQKELETNKQWSSKTNEQQLQWKKDLDETKVKLTLLMNQSQDWMDEKVMLKQNYDKKISDLQSTLNESWAEQTKLNDALVKADSSVVPNCENCDLQREKMFFMDQEIKNFNLEILSKQEEITSANSEIQRLKADLTLWNQNHTKLEDHLKHMEEAFTEEVAQLKEQLDSYQKPSVDETTSHLELKLNIAEEENKQLSDKVNSLMLENGQRSEQLLSAFALEEKLTLSDKNQNELEVQIKKLIEENEKLSKQLASAEILEEKVASTEEMQPKMNNQVLMLKQEKEDIYNNMEAEFTSKLQNNVDVKIIEKLQYNEDIFDQLNAALLECKSKQQESQSYKNTIEELKQQVNNIEAEKQNLESQLEQLKIEREQGVFEFQHDSITYMGPTIDEEGVEQQKPLQCIEVCALGDTFSTRQQQLEQEVDKNKVIIAELQEKLKSELDSIESIRLLSQLTGLTEIPLQQVETFIANHIKELNNDKENLEAKLNAITEEHTNCESDQCALLSKLDKANQTIQELSNVKEDLTQKITLLQETQKVSHCVTIDHDEVSSYKNMLIQEISGLDSSLENLQGRGFKDLHQLLLSSLVKTQKVVFGQMQDSIKELEKKCSVLNSELDEKEKKIDTLCLEIEDLRKDSHFLKNEFSVNTSSQNSEKELYWEEQIKQLNHELELIRNQHADKVSELEDLLHASKIQVEELEKESRHTYKQAVFNEKELKQVLERESNFIEQNTQLENNLQKMREMASELEQEIIKHKQGDSELQQEIISLTEQQHQLKQNFLVEEQKYLDEIQYLQTKVSDLPLNVASPKGTINTITVPEIDDEKSRLSQHISQLEEELNNVNQKVKDLELNLQEIEDEKLSSLEAQEQSQRTITRLETSLAEYQVKIAEMEKCVETEKDNLKKLKEDYSEADQIKAELCELQLQHKEASVQHDNFVETLRKDLQKSHQLVNELQEKLNKNETHVESVSKDYSHIEEQLENFQKQHVNCDNVIQTMESKLQDKISKYNLMKTQFNSMSMEYDQLSEQLVVLQEIESKYHNLQMQHENCKQLHSELELLRRNKKNDATKYEDIQSSLSSLTVAYDELQTLYSALSQEKTDLEDTMTKQKESLTEVRSFNEELRNKIHLKETQINDLQNEVTEKESKIISLQDQIQCLQNKCQEAVNDLNLFKSTAQESTSELQSKLLEYEEVNTRVSMLENDLTKSNTILNTITSERDTLKQKLSEAMTSNEEYSKKLAEAEEEFQDMLQEYRTNNEKRHQLSGEAYRLELQVNKLTNQNLNLQDEVAKLKELSAANCDINKLQQDFEECYTKLEAKELRVAELESQNINLEANAKQYNDDLARLRREFADKRGEFAILKKKMIMDDLPHKQEAENAKSELISLKKKFNNLKSELRNMQANQQDHTFQFKECARCRHSSQDSKETQTENQTSAHLGHGQMQEEIHTLTSTVTRLQNERVTFKEALVRRNRHIVQLERSLQTKESSQVMEILSQGTTLLTDQISKVDKAVSQLEQNISSKSSKEITRALELLLQENMDLKNVITKHNNQISQLQLGLENKENRASQH